MDSWITKKVSRRSFVWGAGTLAAASALGLVGCGVDAGSDSPAGPSTPARDPRDEGLERVTFFAFDTVIELSLYGDRAVLEEAEAACARFDELLAMQKEGSDVWRINHAGGAPCEVSAETADVIERSLAFCAASDGLFDITIGAVSALWDFKEGIKPSDEAIQEALTHVDWRQVHIEGTTVQLDDPQAALDVGGIAKGWIADALVSLYHQRGITSGLINLGGNVYAVGEKPSGAPWTVGIRDPNVSGGSAVATVQVRDRSVVTSGLYERHFIGDDGVDYYHILDPRTGYPAETDLKSDTIISRSSLDGDGLSTTLFIYGSKRAIKELENNPDIDAIFMMDTGETRFSSGFSDYNYQQEVA